MTFLRGRSGVPLMDIFILLPAPSSVPAMTVAVTVAVAVKVEFTFTTGVTNLLLSRG